MKRLKSKRNKASATSYGMEPQSLANTNSAFKQQMGQSPLDTSRQATINALHAAKGQPQNPSVVKVQLNSNPWGFGIYLDGARTQHEKIKVAPGVFIADILPKSDAARYPSSLKIGRQILTVNNVNVTSATVKDVRALFNANPTAVIEVALNKALIRAYRKIRQLKAETMAVKLNAPPGGQLGLLVDGAPNGADGIFVSSKLPGSAAAANDKIQVGDKLVSINGASAVEMNPMQLMNILQTSTSLDLLFVRHQASIEEIVISRSQPTEGFGLRLATSRRQNPTGYVVTSVAPTGPGADAGIKPGWHITSINGANLERMTTRELGSLLAHTSRSALSIKFGITQNHAFLKQFETEKSAMQPSETVDATLSDGPRRLTLTRGIKGSFGVVFCGTSGVRSTEKGVFVSRVIPGTVAATHPDIKRGCQVLEINGIDVSDNHIYTVGRVLNMISTKMTLTLGSISKHWKDFLDTGHQIMGEVGWLQMSLRKSKGEKTWGVVFGGSINDDDIAAHNGIGGIFICGAQSNTAAERRGIPHGYQVMSINSVNVEALSLTQVGPILAAIPGNNLVLAVKKNEALFELYTRADPKFIKLTNTGSGYGIYIAGPANRTEAEALGEGVVISGTKAAGAAGAISGLMVGWQLLEVDGNDVYNATTAEVKQVLKKVGKSMVLKLAPNAPLAKAYQVKLPEYPWIRTPDMTVIRLSKNENGFGLQFIGAKSPEEGEENGFGVMVNGVKEGSAADEHPMLKEKLGWQIGRLNGVDMMGGTFMDLKKVLENIIEPTITMVLINNTHLYARYTSASSQPESDTPTKNTPNYPIGSKVTTLEKGPNGFGLSFGGPKDHDSEGPRGVVVTRLKPGGVAEANGNIRVGWQILMLNDIDLTNGTFVELKAALAQAGSNITLVQMPNEELLRLYGDEGQTKLGQAAQMGFSSATSGFDRRSTFGFSSGAANMLSSLSGTQNSSVKPAVVVTLAKDLTGYGVIFDGPHNEEEAQEYGYGLFVKSIKPNSPASRAADMKIGWQVMAVNGTDVADATFVEFKAALRGVGTELILELEENEDLHQKYLAMRGGVEGVGATPAKGKKQRTDGVVSTIVRKSHDGYGLIFGGANTAEDGEEFGYGIYIRSAKPGSSAASNPDIRENMQVLTMNGVNMSRALIPDLRGVVGKADGELHMTMKENTELASAYAVQPKLEASSNAEKDGEEDSGDVPERMQSIERIPQKVNEVEHEIVRKVSGTLADGVLAAARAAVLAQRDAPKPAGHTSGLGDGDDEDETVEVMKPLDTIPKEEASKEDEQMIRKSSGSFADEVLAQERVAALAKKDGSTTQYDDPPAPAPTPASATVELTKSDKGFGLKVKPISPSGGLRLDMCKPDSPAAASALIDLEGYQMTSLNGTDTSTFVMKELAQLLKTAGNTIVVTVAPI